MTTDDQPIRLTLCFGQGRTRRARHRRGIARSAWLAVALALAVVLAACSGPANATPTLAPRATVAPATGPLFASTPLPPTPTILIPLTPTATVAGGGVE